MQVLLPCVCAGVRGTERPCFVSHFAHSVVFFTRHATAWAINALTPYRVRWGKGAQFRVTWPVRAVFSVSSPQTPPIRVPLRQVSQLCLPSVCLPTFTSPILRHMCIAAATGISVFSRSLQMFCPFLSTVPTVVSIPAIRGAFPISPLPSRSVILYHMTALRQRNPCVSVPKDLNLSRFGGTYRFHFQG
jgi:hypothetical protein